MISQHLHRGGVRRFVRGTVSLARAPARARARVCVRPTMTVRIVVVYVRLHPNKVTGLSGPRPLLGEGIGLFDREEGLSVLRSV